MKQLTLTLLIAFFVAALTGTGRGADVTVSTAAELRTAISGATAGQTILCTAGEYGEININGKKYSGYVTITSADGAMGARFDRLVVELSKNIRFDNIHIDASWQGSTAGFLFIEDSDHIDFINGEINGIVDNSFPGYNAKIFTSTNITMNNTYFHDGGCVYFNNITGLTLKGNRFDRVEEDALKFQGLKDGLIENNMATDYHIFPDPGAHKDFMQFGNGGNNITVRGNVILPAADIKDPYYQGIFMRTSSGTFSNITIENNIIYCGNVNAIYVEPCGANVIVRRNTCLTPLDKAAVSSSIIIKGGSATVEYNIVTSAAYAAGVNGTNHTLQWQTANAPYHYSTYYQNAMKGLGVTLEDLRPVPGGPADFGSGLGAEERIDELLNNTTRIGRSYLPSAPEMLTGRPETALYTITGRKVYHTRVNQLSRPDGGGPGVYILQQTYGNAVKVKSLVIR